MRANNAYPINEDQLKQMLQSYEVEYCEKQWEILENEIATIKAQKSQVFKNFNPKLLVIPAVAIVVIVVLYFNLSNLFSKNTNAETPFESAPIQNEVQHEPTPEPLPPAPKKVVNSAALIEAEKAKIKADSLAQVKKIEEENAKLVQSDTSKVTEAAKDEKNTRIATEQSASEPKGEVVKKKKKKKKKKNSYESIESLRKNSLVPNDADNDVVVPD